MSPLTPHKTPKSKVLRRAIVVVGMHRSGTSALTGMLGIMGAQTPHNQIGAGTQNSKGFFEASKIARLNDALLADDNLTWDSWDALPDKIKPFVQGTVIEAVSILKDEFGNAPLIALKDPRICRLMPFWIHVLKQWNVEPLVLIILRNPVEVAQSLQVRNKFEIAQGLLLWMTYVLQSEADTRLMPRAFKHFNALMDTPIQMIESISDQLKNPFPKTIAVVREEIMTFHSPDLRHHVETDIHSLPQMIQTVFKIFTGWSEHGENAEDYKTLDHINKRFKALLGHDVDAQTLYQAMFHMDNTATDYYVLEGVGQNDPVPATSYRALHHAHEVVKSELETASNEHTKQGVEIGKLSNQIDGKVKRVAQLTGTLKKANKNLADATAFIEGLHQKVAQQDADLAALTNLYLESENTAVFARASLKDVQRQHDVAVVKLKNLKSEQSKIQQDHMHVSNENTELHALVARVENERAQLEGANAKQHGQVTRSEKAQARLGAENTELHALVARVENERARLEAENTDLHALVAQVENERHALASSMSWRATAPLRKVKSIFQRRR